jgi:hypothetical protein
MPADALFEVMAGCTAGFSLAHTETQEGGLKPPLQSALATATISTTPFAPFVVENRPGKLALKVLVESFLLAFCMKCRHADIFHRSSNRSVPGTSFTGNSTNASRFSAVFRSGRLLRRAPFHQSKSK